jgi:hypothetical protein
MLPAMDAISRTLGPIALVGLALAACENTTDITPNAFDATRDDAAVVLDAARADTGGGGGSTGDAAVDPCACLAVGQVFRFDALSLTMLDGGPHPAVPQLNNRWAKDIAGHELDVYFIVTAVDGTDVEIRAVNGAEVAGSGNGTECELPETAVVFHLQREACTLTQIVAAGINIYSGDTDTPKNCAPALTVPNTIPVQQVRLQFDVGAGCGALTNGIVLEASIPAADLRRICTCLANDATACPGASESPNCGGCPGAYSNLETLIQAINAGRAPKYECRTVDGDPAICLEATFSAARVDALPAACAR